MATQVQNNKPSAKNIIAWIMTIGLPVAILLIPNNAVLTFQFKWFLALTLAAILVFVFEQVNITAVAIALPVSYILILKVPAAQVLFPWTMSIPWMIVGGFLLAAILLRIGLLNRIAYKCILLTGASYNGIIWGIGLAGIVLFVMMPSSAIIPLAALAYGICNALHLTKGRESAGITLAAMVAAIAPGSFLFNPGIFVYAGLGQAATGPLTLNWIQFFIQNWVMLPQYLLLLFIITKIFKPQKPINGKEFFQNEYDQLGPLSIEEKRALIVVFFLLIFLLTANQHKIDIIWGFAVIPLLMFLPGLKVAQPEDISNINWGMVVFTVSCLSIGTTGGALGLGQVASSLILPMIEGKSITFFLGVLYVIFVLLNFLLTPNAMMAAFTLPLAEIAMQIGLNPMALYLLIAAASDQIILPYEHVLYLIFFSFGMIHTKDFAKFMGIKMAVNAIFIFALNIPWWKFTGFLYL